MTSLLLLVFCLGLGMLVNRYGRPPPGLAQALNWWVLNIAFTCLVLHLIPQLEFSWSLWYLPVSMWLVFGATWAFFVVVGRLASWSRARIGTLTLIAGLGNTAFVGFPVNEALNGYEGLKLAVVADQTGSFTVFTVGGSLIASYYTGRTVSVTGVLKKVLRFPPFIAFLGGIAVGVIGGWPDILDTVLLRVGSTLTPLALFAVGLQLRLLPAREHAVPVAMALSWKLLAAPLLVFAVGTLVGVHGLERTVATLEAAMPPAVGATLLCQQHELEPQLANTILGLGLLLALPSVYAVYLFTQ